MKKLFLALTMLPMLVQGQTLEECQQAAEKNYPLIQQYGLIEKTTQLTVANIQKGWLPQVSTTAQATYQSDVTAWPDEMKTMMSGMGIDMKGLTKDQYRVGIDVQQTIYDGGVIGSQKRIVHEQGKVQAAQNEVNIYNVRKRVNEMYFSLLLIDEQIKLNNDLQTLLAGNERKLESMTKRGTAAKSDLQNVKAERLNAIQKATELASQKQMLQRMLSTEGAGCTDQCAECSGEGTQRSTDAEGGCVCTGLLWLSGAEYVRRHDAPQMEPEWPRRCKGDMDYRCPLYPQERQGKTAVAA